MKKRISFVLLVIFVLFVVFFFSYNILRYKEIKDISNTIYKNNESFIENIQKLRYKSNITTLQEFTDFEWDEVYQFLPYTYPEDIVGKMKGVYFHTSQEGSDEENLLFLKDGNPVCYIFGEPSIVKVKVNIWDFSDGKNYVMYQNKDINSLVVDKNKQEYVSLYLQNENYRKLYPELFSNIN